MRHLGTGVQGTGVVREEVTPVEETAELVSQGGAVTVVRARQGRLTELVQLWSLLAEVPCLWHGQ